jgi:hypothetical protein
MRDAGIIKCNKGKGTDLRVKILVAFNKMTVIAKITCR